MQREVFGDPEESGLTRGLSELEREAWEHQGYVHIERFIAADACRAMAQRAREFAGRPDEARAQGSLLRYEANFPEALPSQERISKLFRLHDEALFRQFAARSDVIALLNDLIGPNVDFFQSQVIFKLPGSQGQPWHQDAAVFPFEPDRPVVGLWLALTDAEVDNSCLQVLPGSHTQELLTHSQQERAGSGGRYLTLAGIDASYAEQMPMRAGDLLVFDSHLIHRATDNVSQRVRIAASWHFATAGTIDNTAAVFGKSPFNEWIAVLRQGHPVAADRE